MAVGALSGCTYLISSGDGAPPCGPPNYSVNPSSAKVGEQVTVTAADADCDPRYGEDARIQVTVTDATGARVLEVTGPMNDAGGFNYRFEVPVQTAIGEAVVTAVPYNINWCDDTGKNNRADGTARTLQLTSCATPMHPLSIIP